MRRMATRCSEPTGTLLAIRLSGRETWLRLLASVYGVGASPPVSGLNSEVVWLGGFRCRTWRTPAINNTCILSFAEHHPLVKSSFNQCVRRPLSEGGACT